MYYSLFQYLCDFANIEVTQVLEGNVVLALFNCLLLMEKDGAATACLNPHGIWEDVLNIILMYN